MRTKTQAFEDLKSDIELVIGTGQTGAGFHPIHCPMCGNTGEKKGGFKFEDDKIVYNCFRGRCDATTVYDSQEKVPRKFRDLMKALSVSVPVELLVDNKRTVVNLFRDVLEEDRFIKNSYSTMKLPDGIIPMEETRSTEWMAHVIDTRMLLDYEFCYVKRGAYAGCMAIPMYFQDRLIGVEYYTKDGKYITDTDNDNLIFVRNRYPKKNIVVVEGMMDALSFPNTCSVKHSKITPEQAYHLRKYDPIVLPDRKNSKLYECAKEFEWRVCLPGWKYNDLNEAIQHMGILAVAQTIYDNIFTIGLKTDTLHRAWAINDRGKHRR